MQGAKVSAFLLLEPMVELGFVSLGRKLPDFDDGRDEKGEGEVNCVELERKREAGLVPGVRHGDRRIDSELDQPRRTEAIGDL